MWVTTGAQSWGSASDMSNWIKPTVNDFMRSVCGCNANVAVARLKMSPRNRQSPPPSFPRFPSRSAGEGNRRAAKAERRRDWQHRDKWVQAGRPCAGEWGTQPGRRVGGEESRGVHVCVCLTRGAGGRGAESLWFLPIRCRLEGELRLGWIRAKKRACTQARHSEEMLFLLQRHSVPLPWKCRWRRRQQHERVQRRRLPVRLQTG